MTVRATVDPEMQAVAAEALRAALEEYDRSLGLWRGTGQRLDGEVLGDGAGWRPALAALDLPRDVMLDGPWLPAVVLEVGEGELRLGIEGVGEGDPAPVVPREDIAWMKGDFFENFERGDVVLVRAVTGEDGGFLRWSLRQVPEVQGAFVAMDVNSGRVLGDAGGVLLPGERVQPRHPGGPAAGLLVQALRLCGRARLGLHAGDHRDRRADRGANRRRHLDAAELFGALLRAAAAQDRHRAVAQPDDGAAGAGGGDGRGGPLRRALRGLRRDAPVHRQLAGGGGDDALSHGGGLRDVRQRRRAGGADAGGPHPGPARAAPSIATTSAPARIAGSPRCRRDGRRG